MKWRTFSIRTLLLVTLGSALFSGGYRIGYQNGLDGRFDQLIDLITPPLKPNSWDGVGGPGSLPLEPGGYLAYPSDDPFAPTAGGAADDPFAPTSTSNQDSVDPFAVPR